LLLHLRHWIDGGGGSRAVRGGIWPVVTTASVRGSRSWVALRVNVPHPAPAARATITLVILVSFARPVLVVSPVAPVAPVTIAVAIPPVAVAVAVAVSPVSITVAAVAVAVTIPVVAVSTTIPVVAVTIPVMAVTIPVVAPLVTSVVALAVHGLSRDFHVAFRSARRPSARRGGRGDVAATNGKPKAFEPRHTNGPMNDVLSS
jgi:hypothetical protein